MTAKSIPLPLRRVFEGASVLAYGCMRIGGSWEETPVTAADQERADQALDAAIAGGINVFDHADIYCRGKSEQVFGDWLRRRGHDRSSLWIQSKAGIRLEGPAEDYRYDLSPAYIRQQISASLERLGVSYLDAWMLHRPDPLVDPEALAQTLRSLRDDGIVRFFGVSNMPTAQVQLWESLLGPLCVAQQEMSLARLEWLDGAVDFNTDQAGTGEAANLVSYAQRVGSLQLQAWGSLAQGALQTTDSSSALSATLASLASHYRTTAEGLALAFLLRHPAGIQPVVGTTTPARIQACAAALSVELSREDWYRLYAAARRSALP